MLVPGGAGFGLTMGIVMTVLMAVQLRAESVLIRVFDRADFLARLDRAAGKLRYRSIEKNDETIVYETTAPLRMAATRIIVELRGDEAVMSGPSTTLNRLKKEIEKP
jgi:hypothetical protein